MDFELWTDTHLATESPDTLPVFNSKTRLTRKVRASHGGDGVQRNGGDDGGSLREDGDSVGDGHDVLLRCDQNREALCQ